MTDETDMNGARRGTHEVEVRPVWVHDEQWVLLQLPDGYMVIRPEQARDIAALLTATAVEIEVARDARHSRPDDAHAELAESDPSPESVSVKSDARSNFLDSSSHMDLHAELTALLREHDFSRIECQSHDGECCPAGCHDLHENQHAHYARMVMQRG